MSNSVPTHDAPSCAMAYWGVAMSNFHPLWTPPLEPELIKGAKAMALGRQIGGRTKRENDYIMALGEFYNDWKSLTHINRTKKFETAMQKLYVHYPDDQEAPVFYALALNAAADPADKSFANQKKAGTMHSICHLIFSRDLDCGSYYTNQLDSIAGSSDRMALVRKSFGS